MCGKRLSATQAFELVEERQPARRVGVDEPARKSRRNRRRAPGPVRRSRVGRAPSAFRRAISAGRHDHVEMGVMGHPPSPQLVEHGVKPRWAPRCLGSAAMVSSVSAVARNSRS